jgi:HK97 family phage major capsid protein
MATLQEIIDEQTRVAAQLQRMNDNPDTTEDDDGDLRDTLIARWKELEPKREKLVKDMDDVKAITRAANDPANRESGDGGDPAVRRMTGSRGPEFMVRKDPLADREETKDYTFLSRSDVVARAATLVEQHDKRGWLTDNRGEAANRSAQAPSIARHMLMFGGDEYYDAFREYVNDPTGRGLQRAAGALSLAAAQGGFLLPYFLDPTIVITTDGTTNPYRRLASVKQVTTNAYQGVNSAGVQAAFLDEAAAAGTANYQGVGQIQIGVKKAAAWVYGSLEANEDTNFADQLPRLIQDGKDILEENNFAVGTGGTALNSGVPNGVVSALGTAQRVNAAASGAIAAQDIYNLEAALGPRFRMSGSVGFAANIATINKIRSASPSGAGSSFWATLGDGTPSRLLNHVIEESPSVTSTAGTGTASSGTASAQVVFGAWDNFYIVDRIGMSMLFESMITGTGASANIPTGQQGWYAFWRVGSNVSTANAFRWLQYSTG